MSAETLLEIDGLAFGYGPEPFLRVDRLVIPARSRAVLSGPNGSGKTTLLKLMNGLIRPTAGRVAFLGESCAASRELRRRSSYVHQNPYILSGTVSYNVRYGCAARSMPPPEAAKREREALELFGLSGFGRRKHYALSGGEARRVALARAVASGADLLFLDEPTSQADPESERLIREAISVLSRDGATVVISTHDASFAESFADVIIRVGEADAAGRGEASRPKASYP